MQQVDWLFWAVGYFFYLPLHVGLPLLYLLVQGDLERLRILRVRLLLHSVITSAAAFIAAILLWPWQPLVALSVIVFVMLLPWWTLRSSSLSQAG